uniref:FAD_binding_1 domain-containing protein n=1 Tax=Gongylonema pulchrum TaxID=637853 RepID=A0A183D1L0_9BILA
LMQIGQILQTLAIAPFEPPSAHIAHFYSQFDQKSMPRVVQCVLTSHGDSVDSLFAVSTESPPQPVRKGQLRSLSVDTLMIAMRYYSAECLPSLPCSLGFCKIGGLLKKL